MRSPAVGVTGDYGLLDVIRLGSSARAPTTETSVQLRESVWKRALWSSGSVVREQLDRDKTGFMQVSTGRLVRMVRSVAQG